MWMLIPNPPQTMLATSGSSPNSALVTAELALANLEAAMQAAEAARASIGHNQGPPILDARALEEITQAIRQAGEGLAAGTSGISAVKKGQGRLNGMLTLLSGVMLKVAIEQAGKAAYGPTVSLAIRLFHTLSEAVAALGHWLATLPPPPPLV